MEPAVASKKRGVTFLHCISVWYGTCSPSDPKAPRRVVKTAQRITGTHLPSIENISHKRCLGRARNTTVDVSHLNHGLFTPTKKFFSIRLALQVSALLHQYYTVCPGMIALSLFLHSLLLHY